MTRSMPAGNATRRGFGAKPRRTSTGSSQRGGCSIPMPAYLHGRWFVGGICNTCWNAVDRHVMQGRGEQPAIICRFAACWAEGHAHLSRTPGQDPVLAAILGKLGVTKGDRVVLYMPMVPEAAIAMLACGRIGAVHSVVLGGFAASELATRIDDAKPKGHSNTLCPSADDLLRRSCLILILVFAVWLGWLPANGWGEPRRWILPILAYAAVPLATYARYTRAAMLETLNKPFVTVLRAKGLSERRIIFQHVLRNSAIPMVTIFPPMFVGIATGSIFVEAMFRVPGMGSYFVSSIDKRDYPLEMALILLITMLFCISYLVSDVLYALLNPRIRIDGSSR